MTRQFKDAIHNKPITKVKNIQTKEATDEKDDNKMGNESNPEDRRTSRT